MFIVTRSKTQEDIDRLEKSNKPVRSLLTAYYAKAKPVLDSTDVLYWSKSTGWTPFVNLASQYKTAGHAKAAIVVSKLSDASVQEV